MPLRLRINPQQRKQPQQPFLVHLAHEHGRHAVARPVQLVGGGPLIGKDGRAAGHGAGVVVGDEGAAGGVDVVAWGWVGGRVWCGVGGVMIGGWWMSG